MKLSKILFYGCSKLWLKIRIMVENRNYGRKTKFEPGTTRVPHFVQSKKSQNFNCIIEKFDQDYDASGEYL